MKTTLTPSQSATLIAKGISADKASGQGEKIYKPITLQNGSIKRVFDGYTPIFTLADICELLPKELMIDGVTYYLNMLCMETWVANYINAVGDDYVTGILHSTTELIDALYNILLWCLDNNLIKPTE